MGKVGSVSKATNCLMGIESFHVCVYSTSLYHIILGLRVSEEGVILCHG